MPCLSIKGELWGQRGLIIQGCMLLGGNLSRVTWQDGFPPDNPNMGAFAKGIHARFINKV